MTEFESHWVPYSRSLVPHESKISFVNYYLVLIAIGITVTFIFHSFFCSQARFRYLSLFLLSFFVVCQGLQSPLFSRFSRYGRLAEIKWSVSISNFLRPSLQERFWVVHIPFGSMVKFIFFTQFPVDNFPNPAVRSLIHFSLIFPAFGYYVIVHFVSIIT